MKTALKILKWIGIVLGAIILLVVLFFGFLTITEYRPKAQEDITINGEASKTVSIGDSFNIVTWNVGYGSLGEDADFFMDGGSHVKTATKDEVEENIDAIIEKLEDMDADVIFLQEVDEKSDRSSKVNEKQTFVEAFTDYMSSYAYNYKVAFVPYPIPPIGQVNSGILTLSAYKLTSSVRQKLPCPFSYPVRLGNLKRCLLISRAKIEGSDKELVLINLHLEAYDSGEGKAKQTALLKQILEDEVQKGNYVIAGGDFNQVFSNVDTSDYPIIDEGFWVPGIIDTSEFSSNLSFLADNSTPTCRSLDKPLSGNEDSEFQYYMIDGFIVSSNININTVETVDAGFKNSDHNPVVMNVTIK